MKPERPPTRFREFDARRLARRPTAVAIGNFDGLHRGHQRLVRRLIASASRRGLVPLVLTFEPHPERALGRGGLPMIQTLEQRLEGLRALGVEAAVVAVFGKAFAGLSQAEFVHGVLGEYLNARTVVVGEGFRFGRGRRGTVESLRRLGAAAGIRVEAVPPARVGGAVVSSSAVRRLLLRGDVRRAAVLLGRPYRIRGRVVRGAGRGRGLGFPTANLETANEILPPGVFLTRTTVGTRRVPSLTDVGTRPTFGRHPVGVESFLLGFRGSLYGREATLEFLDRIRGERKFASAEALHRRLDRDFALARRRFRI